MLVVTLPLAACNDVMELVSGGGPLVGEDGPYILLEMDTASLAAQQLDAISDEMATVLHEASPRITYTGRGVVGDAARVRLVNATDAPRVQEMLVSLSGRVTFNYAADGLIEARLTDAEMSAATERAIVESVGVLQRRTQRMGIGVARHNERQIIVRTSRREFAGGIHNILTKPAHLTFHLVREVDPADAATGRMPPGSMIAQPYSGVGHYAEVVERRPRLTGDRLMRARSTVDSMTNEFALMFELDAHGARAFCRMTREHVGDRFAVLFDNEVLTAPRINEPICGGTGMISGFTPTQAQDLEIMLNAGALPAPFAIVAEGVGPV